MNLVEKIYNNLDYKTYEFKDGDLVRIKTWDEMESEFGTDDGIISMPDASFIRSMEKSCGSIHTVMIDKRKPHRLFSLYFSESDYHFTKYMVKLYRRKENV